MAESQCKRCKVWFPDNSAYNEHFTDCYEIDINEVIELYNKTGVKRQVSKKLGIPLSILKRVFDIHEIKTVPRVKKREPPQRKATVPEGVYQCKRCKLLIVKDIYCGWCVEDMRRIKRRESKQRLKAAKDKY